MLVAAIDCATASTCVGWVEVDDNGKPGRHAELVAPAQPGHAETLLERLQAVLAAGGHDLGAPSLFVWGAGPGTFTGLRIGLSSIKGLCLASGAALRGVSSLKALALCSPQPGLVAAVSDARRGELFAGLYLVSHDDTGVPCAQCVTKEFVGSVAQVFAQLCVHIGTETAVALGSGIIAHRPAAGAALPPGVRLLGQSFVAPRPLWLALSGYAAFLENGPDDLDSAEPVYLREPDARPPKPPVWERAKSNP
ncbi:MAG: tRNA (adenosine(37)-N6)-threonylcarbamoyltransferase complex dimerization subunit type 1 TsaB [Myxococcota bacterium]|jgi:tRNA threonylcarbamoyladenosine biosynthesis protein TsaB|nr:tRNA (adenosine(37)-N6)-threonylcarbamoyltransferase complex dimerization subunit type 1 TsaB [Myxococcota bacterium]